MSGMPSPSPARINGGDRDKESMWYFSSEDLANSPSRKAGISPDQELSYRQMTAYLIQEMGQRLQVSQLCINTAIVYMHRFYAFHSFTHFHRNGIATASLFLAAKVEEQPRKLEHVIKAANKCLNQPTTSTTDTYYLEQAQDLVFNENVLLQTLGFDVAIDHPHTHVVKTCQLVKACKDLAQTSYFLASNSLHLTSMCLQYKPSVVACFCIYLACKWSRWEIPQSTEGKHWFHYVDETVTMDLLKKLTDEFIVIYEKSPARLKSKLNSIKAMAQGAGNRQGQVKDKKADQDWKVSDMMNMKMYHPAEAGLNNGSQSQSSSSQYSSQGSGGTNEPMTQQQGGSISQPMLPPPPHQPQQMRKPDLHSSGQHRSHHSSSSSTSHHPAKIGYSPSDVPDQKLSSGHSKQQQQQQMQPYGGSNMVSNRPPRDHNPSSMMGPSSKQSSSSSSSRSSMPNSLPGPPLRQSSQGHPIDVNYHKSRERGMAAPPPPSGHSMPPHGMPHKLAQKPDGTRSISSKDHSGRLAADQGNKQSNNNSNNNKMFSSSVSSQYGGNNLQMPPGSNSSSNQLSSKLDNMHDITRNLMHTSRGSYSNPPPPPQPSTNGPTATPLLNFHQQQQSQISRHSSNTCSNNNSLKHEQSKQQISVHMQQQSQTAAHHHKQPQPLPTDQSYGSLSGPHDLQQQPHAASSLINSNNYSKVEPLQHSEEPPHPVNQYNQQAQSHAAKAANSLFSPEWNDKLQTQQQDSQMSQQLPPPNVPGSGLNCYMNNSGNLTQNTEPYAAGGYKIPSSSITNKESSPPKIKTERDTPSKKDKNRSNSSNQDNGRSTVGHASAQQHILKTTIPKKLESSLSISTGLNELAGTSNMGTVGGIKRPNETVTIKQEDDLITRESKIRKIDTTANNDLSKHLVVNGIETNPDLVRNLLKESLCSTSGLLKTEPSIITPSLQPPAELFEPSATTSLTNQHNTSITSISTNALSGNSDVSAMETDDHGTTVNKSEKKKKKEKHKHKEKDKSKDREERKKHKKDKDRHKDKDRDRDNNNDNGNSSAAGTAEHVKIKISKEKLEAAGEPIGFKIKIPKDRIMGDLNTGSSGQMSTDSIASLATPVLKIKISKDKLESYSSGSTDLGAGLTAATHPSYAHNPSISYNSYGTLHSNPSTTAHSSSSNSGSGSSKKKDRDREKDRERDKDKKRSHDSSSSKSSNSGGGGGGGGSSSLLTAGIVGSNITNGSIAGQIHSNSNSSGSSTTQKTQYSSKIHHQSSMSLLFGESNESNDDDDDYNDDY